LTRPPKQPAQPEQERFLTLLSLSFVAGMAIALAFYLLWRSDTVPETVHRAFVVAAMIVCPPFILSVAGNAAPDSPLTQVLLAGTILFANAFLYAGVAAGIYFLVTALGRGKG